MTIEEIELIKTVCLKEVDPSKRHVIVVDVLALSKSEAARLGDVWHREFGKYPIVIYKRGGDVSILEIKP